MKTIEITMDEVFKLKAPDLQKHIAMYFKLIKRPFVQTDGFIYSKGSIPLLLVAHMDTVHRESPTICKSGDEKIWMAPEGIGGDDRCGIWIILQILQKHDVHVLFTQGEEKGCIGATEFTKCGIYPEVNFIIEIDRKGYDDAVFYDCGNKKFKDFILEHTGFTESYGSFSDISVLSPHLNRASVNLSSGYYNPHTSSEYINTDDMDMTKLSVESVIEEMDWGIVYDYQEERPPYKGWGGYGKGAVKNISSYRGYGWEDWDDYPYYGGSDVKYAEKSPKEDISAKPKESKEEDKKLSSLISSGEEDIYGDDEWDDVIHDETRWMLQQILALQPEDSLTDDVAEHVKRALCDYGYL